MRRISLVLFLVGAVLLSTRAVQALGAEHQSGSSLPLLRYRALHAHAAVALARDASLPRQVQSGAITDAGQLQEPASVYPSDFSGNVAGQKFTANNADDEGYKASGLFFALLHSPSQSGGFSYKSVGMLFGFAEVATKTFPDNVSFYLEYLASAYTTPDAASNAFNSLVSYYTTFSNAQQSTCSFAGANQCLNVTIPDAVTITDPNTLITYSYAAILRILQKSNSVWEGGLFLPRDDVNQNKDLAAQAIDGMSSGYIALFNTTQGPGPAPTLAPTQAQPTATLVFKPPAKPTATPTPTQPATLPTQAPTQARFNLVKVQFEKVTGQPKDSDPAVKKAKSGTRLFFIVFFNVDSGPPNLSFTGAYSIKNGSRIVQHSKDTGRLDANNPAGLYYFRTTWKSPKATGTYAGTYAITMSGKTLKGSAKIKIVKK